MSSSTSGFKAFLSAFGIGFVIPLAVSIGATEIMLRKHVIPFDSYYDYKHRFLASTAPTAAFGDSHVARDLVNTSGFDNFGQTSDSLRTIFAKIEHRLNRGGLRQIVIQADPHSFAPYRLKAKQESRMADLVDAGEPLLAISRPQYRQYLMGYWQAVIQDPGLLVREPKHGPEPESQGEKINSGPADTHATFLRVQLHTPIRNVESAAEAAYLRDLLARIRQAGVQACLVSFPLSSAYRDAANMNTAFHDANLFFRETAKSAGMRYLDYSSAMPDTCFAADDPDHISSACAVKFQDKMLADCFGDQSEGNHKYRSRR